MKPKILSKPRYITNLDELKGISQSDLAEAKKVAEKFPFMANDYYLSLINWDDPKDPIRSVR
ncbi:MAG: hypothetical protein BWY69_01848 [Planctomycetes bacterium ADurb.Bin401]|nr:MAG: hypothetical protein BWY69_01848 [Planctomycetes bacterium ADurb.Bin401]